MLENTAWLARNDLRKVHGSCSSGHCVGNEYSVVDTNKARVTLLLYDNGAEFKFDDLGAVHSFFEQ